MLECLLGNYPHAQVQTAIESQHPADYAKKLKGELETIEGKLRESILFRALLAD